MNEAHPVPKGTVDAFLATMSDYTVEACIQFLLETGMSNANDTFFPQGMEEQYLGTFPKELLYKKASEIKGVFHGGPPGDTNWHDESFLYFTLDRTLYTITDLGFPEFYKMVKDTQLARKEAANVA